MKVSSSYNEHVAYLSRYLLIFSLSFCVATFPQFPPNMHIYVSLLNSGGIQFVVLFWFKLHAFYWSFTFHRRWSLRGYR